MQVVGKRHYGRKAVPAGGGGGGDLSALDPDRLQAGPALAGPGEARRRRAGPTVDVPLADSLSAYKLVAIATAGGDLFGTGSATIRTVQDLTIYSGLPPLVRSGDEYGATFTLQQRHRQADERDRQRRGRAGPVARPAPQTVTVPAGGAVPVTWRLTAPDHVDNLRWTVSARSADGTLDRPDPGRRAGRPGRAGRDLGGDLPPDRPRALPGRSARRRPARPRQHRRRASPIRRRRRWPGVRAYMRCYPYGCFEQRLSKAVALDDAAAWAAMTGRASGLYRRATACSATGPATRCAGRSRSPPTLCRSPPRPGFEWPEERKAEADRGAEGGRRRAARRRGRRPVRHAAAPHRRARRARPQRRRDPGDGRPGRDPASPTCRPRCSPTG